MFVARTLSVSFFILDTVNALNSLLFIPIKFIFDSISFLTTNPQKQKFAFYMQKIISMVLYACMVIKRGLVS